ncbi:hypothetical protein Lepto7375DRAFT_7156 [Leptolyngbya sp. PCC 7375]|nr:hypothetical protein Lepto7375DRAFT_7156 [Leptolyngbya sp. PCC 7375]
MLVVDSGNYGQGDAGHTGFSETGGACLYSAVLAPQASAPMSMFSNQVRLLRDSEGRQVTPRRLSGFAQRA